MNKFTVVLFFLCKQVAAQNNVAHFSFWKPKAGMSANFEAGYKQHLKWHRDNGDKWSWHGWYIVGGIRDDQFVDATFDHSWEDFDNSIKPAQDGADNDLHTYPFGDYQAGWKLIKLRALSFSDSIGLKSRFLRFVVITVSNTDTTEKILEQLKSNYQANGVKTFLTFKMADGGSLNQYLLLIGMSAFKDFSKTENLQGDLSKIESSFKIKVITSITSETLVYKDDMSYFPN